MQKIKNIEKAAERIRKAVSRGQRIILYGDSDLDGISSVVILEEAIKSLGGEVNSVFFPDRENDGYGINQNALDILKNRVPALLITLDLGIGNIKEVRLANQMGFEVLIVDHHEALAEVPEAFIIVDPKQKDDDYPFKNLANVGITFKLCEELLGHRVSQQLRNSFLELAALGTIADMVPQVDENQRIIEEGLRSLKNTFRPALRAFLEIIGAGQVFENSIQKIISGLNAAEDSINFENDSYRLLTCPSLEKCKEMAQALLDRSKNKQQQIKNIIQEVERRVSEKTDQPIIFEGDPAWRLTFAGSVASQLCQKYEKPVFIYKKLSRESCGSVRNPKGTNSVEAMKICAGFLLTYGGHAQASGFRVKNENLEKFQTCLNNYFKK